MLNLQPVAIVEEEGDMADQNLQNPTHMRYKVNFGHFLDHKDLKKNKTIFESCCIYLRKRSASDEMSLIFCLFQYIFALNCSLSESHESYKSWLLQVKPLKTSPFLHDGALTGPWLVRAWTYNEIPCDDIVKAEPNRNDLKHRVWKPLAMVYLSTRKSSDDGGCSNTSVWNPLFLL